MTDWNRRYYAIAEQVAAWSKDWSTQVGCVVFDPITKSLLTVGYNGFPRGIDDDLEERKERIIKNKLTVHAEANAILNAARSGLGLEGTAMVTTFYPCAACAGAIIQSGIDMVITKEPDWNHERWGADFLLSKRLFEETGVEVIFIKEETIQ